MSKRKYPELDGLNLSRIRNSNERRVKELLPEVLKEYPGYEPDSMDLEDIYALALNYLPPKYKQPATVVISGRIKDDEVYNALRDAVERVRINPTDT